MIANDNDPPEPARAPVRMVRILGTITADSFTPPDVVQLVPIPLELLRRGPEEP